MESRSKETQVRYKTLLFKYCRARILKFFCYILYSKSFDRYYVGYTSDIEERLKLHNTGYFRGKSYTHFTSDWELFLLIPCDTIKQAVFIESKIKKMKSRKYIEDLNKYPEMVAKILDKFYSL
jgi:putative endonuclease